MEKLKVVELFAGYGSQSMSLRDCDIDHEVLGISEVEPDAIIAYGSIRYNIDDLHTDKTHDEMKEELMAKNVGWDFKKQKSKIPRMKKSKLEMLYKFDKAANNFGDISIINPNDLPDFDYMTYSFPCQSISLAGTMEGIERGQTRSGLLYECEKIIETKKPKYLLMENVKNLVGKKFRGKFDEWCEYLEGLGYTNYHNNYKCLNAKDFGLAQNRERIFMISVLDDENTYEFPEGEKLTKRLKDFLEDKVDEKYYLSEEIQKRFKPTKKDYGNNSVIRTTTPDFRTIGQRDLVYSQERTMGATDYKQPKQIIDKADRLGGCFDDEKGKHQAGSVWNKEGLSPTLDTMQGGYRTPLIFDEIWKEFNNSGYFVSDFGNVKNKNGAIKSQREDKDGYLRVNLYINGEESTYSVHSLVASLFIDNDEDKKTVNHKDGNTKNNHVSNLEWMTIEENLKHKKEVLRNTGSKPNQPRGVSYSESRRKWESFIKVDGKTTFLGRFDSKEDAYLSYYNKFIEINGYTPWEESVFNVCYRQPLIIDNIKIEKIGELDCKGWHEIETRVHSQNGLAPTVECRNRAKYMDGCNFRIRKLTPRECLRLQGVPDKDIDKMMSVGLSDSALYKLSGNSIPKNILDALHINLFFRIRTLVCPNKQ